ncbi:hypothetical protein Zmor_012840 [Zophobas morio]|uniref:Uncharacterized protein n=1 Tax=Zophobas morio TaxID=2755281 RepID=A0AA38IEK1_9CUCU|nr:hypothetical protein Zmor_012840 [Zophobas morio]
MGCKHLIWRLSGRQFAGARRASGPLWAWRCNLAVPGYHNSYVDFFCKLLTVNDLTSKVMVGACRWVLYLHGTPLGTSACNDNYQVGNQRCLG